MSTVIEDGRLCRYRYYPIPVALTDAEANACEEITIKPAKFFSCGEDDTEIQQAAMELLIKGSRLLAGAENKLTTWGLVWSGRFFRGSWAGLQMRLRNTFAETINGLSFL